MQVGDRPNIRVIQAELEHLDLIAPLFDAYRQYYDQPPDLSGTKAFLENRLTNNESTVFLAIEEADAQVTPAGFTQLYPLFSSVSMKRLWLLNDLYVAATHRRAGVARSLMDSAIALAKQTKAKGIILETAIDNTAARPLYDSLGFTIDEELLHYTLVID